MITPDILNPETRKQEKALEYRQKRINTIRFTPDRDGVPFSHLDCRKYIRKVFIALVISELLKKVLISERNGVILLIDMVMSMFFGGT